MIIFKIAINKQITSLQNVETSYFKRKYLKIKKVFKYINLFPLNTKHYFSCLSLKFNNNAYIFSSVSTEHLKHAINTNYKLRGIKNIKLYLTDCCETHLHCFHVLYKIFCGCFLKRK